MARGFYKLPREVAERRDLSSAAARAYAALADWIRWRPGAPVGAQTLGARAGLPRTTAQRALLELERKGLINVKHRGNGRSTLYRLAVEGDGATPTCFPERCPLAGRHLPTAGPVSCPLTARIAPTPGRPDLVLDRVDPLREQERAGLSLSTLDFGEWLRRKRGRRLSDRQLWEVNPAFAAGVPVGYARLAADTWALGVPPWTFAENLIAAWGEVAGAVEACRRHYVDGQGDPPTVEVARRVLDALPESELPSVFGERWRAAVSWAKERGAGVRGAQHRC